MILGGEQRVTLHPWAGEGLLGMVSGNDALLQKFESVARASVSQEFHACIFMNEYRPKPIVHFYTDFYLGTGIPQGLSYCPGPKMESWDLPWNRTQYHRVHSGVEKASALLLRAPAASYKTLYPKMHAPKNNALCTFRARAARCKVLARCSARGLAADASGIFRWCMLINTEPVFARFSDMPWLSPR